MANAQTEQREKKTVWQWLCWAGDRYFIKAMSSMALGLFASLIIGLILSQLAQVSFLAWLQPYADMVASSSPVVGSAIGVAVASGLKAKPLVVFTSAVTGAIGYDLGGPVGAFLAAVVGAELGNLVAGGRRLLPHPQRQGPGGRRRRDLHPGQLQQHGLLRLPHRDLRPQHARRQHVRRPAQV